MSRRQQIVILGDESIDFSLIEENILNSEPFSKPVANLIRAIEQQQFLIQLYNPRTLDYFNNLGYELKQKDLKTDSV